MVIFNIRVKMAQPQAFDLFGAFKNIYYFSKFIGYWPESYTQQAPAKLPIKSLIGSVLGIGIQLHIAYTLRDPIVYKNVTSSKILNFGIWAQLIVVIVLNICFMLLALLKIDGKNEILRKFKEIDDILVKNYHVELYYMKIGRATTYFLLVNVSLLLSVWASTTYYIYFLNIERNIKIYTIIGFFWSHIGVYTQNLQFIIVVIYIGSRYFHINNILRQLIPDISIRDYVIIADQNNMFAPDVRNNRNFDVQYHKNSIFLVKEVYPQSEKQRKFISDNEASSNQRSARNSEVIANIYRKTTVWKLTFTKHSTTPDIVMKLHELIRLHSELVECATKCNDFFGFQTLATSVSLFAYTVFGLFSMYINWADNQLEASSVAKINVGFIFLYSIATIIFTTVNERLLHQAKQTAIIIHQIAFRTDDPVLLKRFLVISEMLLTQQPTIAHGLLVFDWSFVYTMLATIAMYLTILVQFNEIGKMNRSSLR